jgi:L-asparagine oxygenase
LIDFRRNSNDTGTLLIRGFPTDPVLPTTPPDGRVAPFKRTMVSEYILLLTMMHLGEPIAYQDEKEGALIHNICPVKGREQNQENVGSVFLGFHCENAFHPYRPDFIGLVCLRADHDMTAQTATASVLSALPALDKMTIALLREPIYRHRAPSSFTNSQCAEVFSTPQPVLTGNDECPELCVDFFTTEALTEAGERALAALKQALLDNVIATVLLPGDLVIVDNRVAVHGRTAITPRYDGRDRWLQRLFVVHDFRRSLAMRSLGSHVCEPLVLA